MLGPIWRFSFRYWNVGEGRKKTPCTISNICIIQCTMQCIEFVERDSPVNSIQYRSIPWSTIQHTTYNIQHAICNTLRWVHLDKSEKCLSREVDPGWMIQQLNLTIVKHPFFLHIHTYYILYLAHSSRVDHLPARSFNFFQTHFHTLL